MIDHMTLTVRDLARSRSLYEKLLAPLGYRVLMEFGEACGFGDEKPYFWVKQGDTPTTPQHIAFVAPSRAAVDAFHAAALAAGARDNGPPGLRPDYHASYYGAFILDPDDHNLEAVTHRPEGAGARRGGAKRAGPRAAARKPAARAAGRGKAKRAAGKPKRRGRRQAGRTSR
jgi:catechol 2,3-dioxygenase-like lactoylglutathione lyase family enzyme